MRLDRVIDPTQSFGSLGMNVDGLALARREHRLSFTLIVQSHRSDVVLSVCGRTGWEMTGDREREREAATLLLRTCTYLAAEAALAVTFCCELQNESHRQRQLCSAALLIKRDSSPIERHGWSTTSIHSFRQSTRAQSQSTPAPRRRPVPALGHGVRPTCTTLAQIIISPGGPARWSPRMTSPGGLP